ncbi:MAG: aminotransferase class III-fold pyridoxal phosphate-dependent enzyme, partial [Alphaproteobacteria bacterium]|nr:aminotransferase class III-fold pyridoxal phosphate-dependent enzyme [Alphaproteobacteria bacterium]
MPFTGNRAFKQHPRMMASADGMYYRTVDGREIVDGISGLWCCNAGHNRPRIVDAIRKQAGELDYSPAFQIGHHKAFELANRLVKLMPGTLDHVFFTNSGSESVETALKIALAYHRIRGEGGRVRLIGREKGYHGVNFGGTAVGGMMANRKMFGTLVAGVDHLHHTHGIPENRFSRGEPEHGADYADDLERLCQLHDPSTIAAVIVE